MSEEGGGAVEAEVAGVSSEALAAAEAVLDRLVTARCLDPAEPWALVHGMIARGIDLEVGGERAIDRFVRENLDASSSSFPASRGAAKVEPHPGYFAKNALELGLPLEHAFPAPGGRVTLGELVGAQARAYAPAPRAAPFFDEEWRLELVAAAAERDPAQAERLAALREGALEALRENQSYLEPWLEDPTRPYDKPSSPGPDGKPQPAAIHRYACGGLHLFQAVQRLHGREVPPALALQYRLLRLRLVLEPRYWEAKLAEARARFDENRVRRHEAVILAQALKLLGHGLETWLRAEATGALALTPEEVAEAEQALVRLTGIVLELDRRQIFAALDEIRSREPQLYLDLVGDGAHALHALHLWGARSSR